MSQILTKASIIQILNEGIPDAEWLLGQIESQEGWFRFPTYISSLITNLKLESYPLLYLNENAIAGMLLKGFLTDEEIRDLNTELEAASPEERGDFIISLNESINEGLENFNIPKTPAEQEQARKAFLALTPEEQAASIKLSQHFFCSFLSSFYQMLSIMVHGEKLTALVGQALNGNDDAFVKAVQIDKRILTAIPYFRERFTKAQDDSDSNFYDYLSYRIKAAPYKGKIRYKSLWLAFSLLDQAGLLNTLSAPEILQICDDAGIGGFDNRIQSPKHLSNRLKEYRQFQKRGLVTTI